MEEIALTQSLLQQTRILLGSITLDPDKNRLQQDLDKSYNGEFERVKAGQIRKLEKIKEQSRNSNKAQPEFGQSSCQSQQLCSRTINKKTSVIMKRNENKPVGYGKRCLKFCFNYKQILEKVIKKISK